MESERKTIMTLDDQNHCLANVAEAISNGPAGLLEAEIIIKDLKNTLLPLMPAAGLAAPQIGISKKVIIFSWDRTPEHIEAAINPIFKPLNQEKILGWEGCFSVPLALAKVPRYQTILATYTTLEGKKVRCKLQGFAARVFQHECDHLEGIENIHRDDAEVRKFISKDDLMLFINNVKKSDIIHYIKPEYIAL